MKANWHLGVLAVILSSPMVVMVLDHHKHSKVPALNDKDVVVACIGNSPMPLCTASDVLRSN